MIARYALLFTTLLAASVFAQPLLTYGDLINYAGTTFNMNTGDYVEATEIGPNQTWDYSALNSLADYDYTFVSVAGSPEHADYPGATQVLRQIASTDVYYYWQSTLDGRFEMGKIQEAVYQEDLSNTRKILHLPLHWNYVWSDDYSGTWFLFGSLMNRSGNFSAHALAYGTLILPGGTFTDVLRLDGVNQYSDVGGPSSIDVIEYTYEYYKAGVPLPLLRTVSKNTTVNGETTVEEYSYWLTNNALAVPESRPAAIQLSATPNPATDLVYVTLASGPQAAQDVQVLNSQGAVMLRSSWNDRARMNTHVLDVSSLPGGLYTVRVSDARGVTGVRRLIIE